MTAVPSPTTPTPGEQDQEDALQGLLDYCNEQSIKISASIAARRFPGRGLGIYAIRPIRRGESLIHVPTRALFTTQTIPDSFLSKNVKKQLTVHCLLAAYLAFGNEDELIKYQRWIATWPKLEDFVESLPVFWHEDFREDGVATPETDPHDRATKRPRMLASPTTACAIPQFSRSPGIDGYWITMPEQDINNKQDSHLTKQADKIRACIDMVDQYLPRVNIRHPDSYNSYLRFLHMWSCVSTRCFYYLRPGQSPPEDSNEAMALCPFQDLFNHSDAQGCHVRFDKKGYFVAADKDYKEGEEIFLNYGRHSNDMLWMEYGFTMVLNEADVVNIDRVILHGIDDAKRRKLDASSYLGDYKLGTNGVCYRTVTASYLGVLTDEQWQRMVHGGLNPETNIAHLMLKQKAKRQIVDWILLARREAEHNLNVLSKIADDDELFKSFADKNLLSGQEAQMNTASLRIKIAYRRKEMCIHRWKQIFDMCMSTIREIEQDCPGSYLRSEKGERTNVSINQSADQFITAMVNSS